MSNFNNIPKSPKIHGLQRIICNNMEIKSIEKNVFFYFQGRSYFTSSMYVPRVRANAYHVLTTPPRVLGDPKMCLRNIWTAPKCDVLFSVFVFISCRAVAVSSVLCEEY